jgi:hypothetical protein
MFCDPETLAKVLRQLSKSSRAEFAEFELPRQAFAVVPTVRMGDMAKPPGPAALLFVRVSQCSRPQSAATTGTGKFLHPAFMALGNSTRCSLIHRCDLYRLSFVRRQDAAEGHANHKHRGKHHSNHAIVSWRSKPSHLLVQEFLIASVHFDVPILSVRNAAKLPLFHWTVAERNIGFQFEGR